MVASGKRVRCDGGVAAGWGRTDRVPPVLDRVVGSARQLLGNERPLGAHLLDELHDELLFLLRPVLLVHRRAQVVVPPEHAGWAACDARCDTPHDIVHQQSSCNVMCNALYNALCNVPFSALLANAARKLRGDRRPTRPDRVHQLPRGKEEAAQNGGLEGTMQWAWSSGWCPFAAPHHDTPCRMNPVVCHAVLSTACKGPGAAAGPPRRSTRS